MADWVGATFASVLMASSSQPLDDDTLTQLADVNRALTSLEADTQALTQALLPPVEVLAERWAQHATRLQASDPETAAASWQLAATTLSARWGVTANLLEAARAAARGGQHDAALTAFAEASKTARKAHQIWSAVEGYAISLPYATRTPPLPALERYVATSDDEHANETLYAIARALVTRGHEQADRVLGMLPVNGAVGRRGAYLWGVWHLKQDRRDAAVEAFARAATLTVPDAAHPERDVHVRDSAWMALGRLYFEASDYSLGMYAYQHVHVDSPRFADAFLELGWLALEQGRENTARAAFDAVTRVAAGGELGRKAVLLEGYVLLIEQQFEAAESHYQLAATRLLAERRALLHSAANLGDLRQLAQSCDVRERARQDSALREVADHPATIAAMHLEERVVAYTELGHDLERLAADAVRVASRGDEGNPLVVLERDSGRVVALLERAQELRQHIGELADGSRRTATLDPLLPPNCCSEPSVRVRRTIEHLEKLLAGLGVRKKQLEHELRALQHELRVQAAEQRRALAEWRADLPDEQRRLVRRAVTEVSEELWHLALEGEAGALEAVWRYKEAGSGEINRLEQEKNRRLGELEESMDWATSLGE